MRGQSTGRWYPLTAQGTHWFPTQTSLQEGRICSHRGWRAAGRGLHHPLYLNCLTQDHASFQGGQHPKNNHLPPYPNLGLKGHPNPRAPIESSEAFVSILLLPTLAPLRPFRGCGPQALPSDSLDPITISESAVREPSLWSYSAEGDLGIQVLFQRGGEETRRPLA